MLQEFLLVVALGAANPDPINAAMEQYQRVESYQLTLISTNDGDPEVIRYHYKKPGFVRMDFVKPFKGAVMIYSPFTNKVRLWPFGSLHVPGFAFSPENRLVRSSKGHRVDQSDVGALLRNVKALQEHGKMEVLGEEAVGGKPALHVAVWSTKEFSVDNVSRYDLWLESATLFPLKVISRDKNNRLLETLLMDDLKINPEFPDGFFDP